MTPIVLRKISKQGLRLTNCCWYDTKGSTPMVGSKFCKNNCPHYKGTMRLLFWKFVKCSYFRLI